MQTVRNAEKAFNTSESVHGNEIPVELYTMIKWVLGGFNMIRSLRDDAVARLSRSICNNILYNMKSNRPASYRPNEETVLFRHRYENSQVIKLAVAVRQHSRNQGLVDMLHSIGDCISTKRCLRIETAIANEIIRQTKERGYYLPSNTKSSRIVQFHLDNTNFHEDGDDGKNVTNALLLVGSQYTTANVAQTQESFKIPRSTTTKLLPNNFGSLLELDFTLLKLYKRSESWASFKTYLHTCHAEEAYRNYLKPWLIAKSVESSLSTRKVRDINVSLDIDDTLSIELEFNANDKIAELDLDQTDSQTKPILEEFQVTLPDLRSADQGDNDLRILEMSGDSHLNLLHPVLFQKEAEDAIINIGISSHNSENSNSSISASSLEYLSSVLADLRMPSIPSYTAYNSILAAQDETHHNIANILMFPLIAGPADNYNAIYTGFKLAQNVTTHICDEKTITALDLDLYERTLKLRNSSPDLMKNFVLRLGELHIVFAQCRAIGRYLENTGIDDAWLKSQLIGPCTIRQVVNCSHMKRALIVHEATLLAMHELYVTALIKENPNIFFAKHKELTQNVVNLNQALSNDDLENIPSIHAVFHDNLLAIDNIINSFDCERTNNSQCQMIKTYMRMVERLLLFIHASRSRNWKLHLSTTEELMRDITSMDRIKYRRMLPVYLAEMYALESSDPLIWEAFIDGEFAVQTNEIPFTGIGMDHRGEQVNKVLKIEGGVVGILRNENAHTRYMLNAPVLAEI